MSTENMKTDSPATPVITRCDLLTVNIRWLFASQICWNYERMMSTGYLYSMLPALRKIYRQPADLQEMMAVHNQFFNTNPMVGRIILGIDIAIEEHQGKAAKNAIAGLKTGLMGPFAGVGDTLFGVILPTIFGSIAAWMGLQGNPFGVFLWMAVNIIAVFVILTFLPLGYRQGVKLVSQLSGKLSLLTDSAILLGVMVVGALIPTVIHTRLAWVYRSGKVTLSLQDMADKIMPSLAPLIFVAATYWLLGLKRMTSTRVILLVMAIAIMLYNLNILV